MKALLFCLVFLPILVLAQGKHDFGIQLSLNPTLSKTSTTNFDKVGQGLNRPLFKQNGVKFPLFSFAYGFGIFYTVGSRGRIELNYESLRMGQRSGRQFFVNSQVRYGYLLQLERLTNDLSLFYSHSSPLKDRPNLKYYWSGGILLNSSTKYLEQFFNWPDSGLEDKYPASYRLISAGGQSMVRIGLGLSGGISFEWRPGVVLSSGIRYKILSDAMFYIDPNGPRGMANLLQLENKIAVSIF